MDRHWNPKDKYGVPAAFAFGIAGIEFVMAAHIAQWLSRCFSRPSLWQLRLGVGSRASGTLSDGWPTAARNWQAGPLARQVAPLASGCAFHPDHYRCKSKGERGRIQSQACIESPFLPLRPSVPECAPSSPTPRYCTPTGVPILGGASAVAHT